MNFPCRWLQKKKSFFTDFFSPAIQLLSKKKYELKINIKEKNFIRKKAFLQMCCREKFCDREKLQNA